MAVLPLSANDWRTLQPRFEPRLPGPAAALGLQAGSPTVRAPAETLRSSAPGQPRGHKSPHPVTDRVSGRYACIRTGTL